MRSLLIAGLLATMAMSASARESAAPRCNEGASRTGDTASQARTVRKLGEMPPAAAIRTVYRRVDGCPAPIVLRRGIGANRESAPTIEGEARSRLIDR